MIDLKPSEINGYGCDTDPGEPGTNVPRLSVNDTEGHILAALVRGMDVLEIGTGLGVSTQYLAAVARRVYTVDIDPWVQANVWPGLPANVIKMPSLEGIPLCCHAAFVDGMHTYEACKRDIELAQLNVRVGGLIIFHDLYIQGVQQAVFESGLPFVHIHTTAGMALAWNDKG